MGVFSLMHGFLATSVYAAGKMAWGNDHIRKSIKKGINTLTREQKAANIHEKHYYGSIMNMENSNMVRFQYNPPEWYYERTNGFNEIGAPGMEYPTFYWTGGDKSVIRLDLDFYEGASPNANISKHMNVKTPEEIMDVIDEMATPRKLATGIVRSASHFICPPRLMFTWGSEKYVCVMQKYKFQKKRFDKFLRTIMLTVSVELLVIQKW